MVSSVSKEQIQQWLDQSFPELVERSVVIRIVENTEIQQLNSTYRQQDKPTNILSFPYEPMTEIEQSDHLGDLVIALSVMMEEAEAGNKPFEHHFAHLLIHGVLHLLGYDHEEEQEATLMEAREIELLAELEIPSPY